MRDSKRDTDVQKRLLDSAGEGEGGMIWENGIETCMYHVRNELPLQVRCRILDAWGWCTEVTQKDGKGWGTRVYLWWIHVDVWQNQYNIVK